VAISSSTSPEALAKRTIAALIILRDQVIVPILAGSPIAVTTVRVAHLAKRAVPLWPGMDW
jgi:hypothetical protein